MKKFVTILLAICLSVTCFVCLFGCDDEKEDSSNTSTTSETSSSTTTKKVDLDCSKLSSALAYQKVYDMMYNPDSYIGKRVKVKGTFSRTTISGGSSQHYFVDVYDNTACCSAWLTFTWSGHVYPDEFPESNETVTVVGKITTFTEGGETITNIKAESVTF